MTFSPGYACRLQELGSIARIGSQGKIFLENDATLLNKGFFFLPKTVIKSVSDPMNTFIFFEAQEHAKDTTNAKKKN